MGLLTLTETVEREWKCIIVWGKCQYSDGKSKGRCGFPVGGTVW